MKTNIKSIRQTISKYYKDVEIRKYYIEDENAICQKIVLYGEANGIYFAACIIGLNRTEFDIMKEMQMSENRYEALYIFSIYI